MSQRKTKAAKQAADYEAEQREASDALLLDTIVRACVRIAAATEEIATAAQRLRDRVANRANLGEKQ